MKKILIAGGIVVVIALYAIFASRSNTPATNQPITSVDTGTTPASTTVAAGGTPPTQSGNGSSGGSIPAGQYKDGTYTGPVTDAIYGQIQVVAVIQNGKLTKVEVPVYPNSAGHTMEVSQQSLPVLEQEAIQSQNASVNIVSGATQTSQGFQQSLAAALAVAN